MRLGIRAKLFGVSMLLIVLVGGASGGYLEFELRTLLESRADQELFRLGRVAVEAAASAGGDLEGDPIAAHRLAERLAAASQSRMTILAPDGRVLGDSELDLEDIVRRAPRVATLAADRRFSRTVEVEMREPQRSAQGSDSPGPGAGPGGEGEGEGGDHFPGSSSGSGIESLRTEPLRLRIALPLGDVEGVVRRLRVMILGAGFVGLAIAVLMSGLASHMVSTAFRQLVDKTRALAQGASRRIEVESRDELGHLAGSINKMAEDLERTVTTLAAERDRFETVLRGMSEAIFAIDADQVITVMNPAMRLLLGPSKLAEGYRLAEVARVPALLDLVATAASGPASADFSLPGETERRVLARATPLRASGGMVVVMLDVTEMRRLERIRKDFVANVSHELRTPVSIIRANAETLLSGALEDPARARGFVEAQLRSVERLSSLVADLLDLARIEAGKFRFELTGVGVTAVLEGAREAVRGAATSKDLRVEVEADPGLQVRADPRALDQIVLNLVDNAAKYARPGGLIQLRGHRAAGVVRLEVEDDGPGIEPRHRVRVFERFYRIDAGRSRDVGGTGLGLAIVKHLAESMNGQVGVDGREPHGSIFWVTLPAEPVSDSRADGLASGASGLGDAASPPCNSA